MNALKLPFQFDADRILEEIHAIPKSAFYEIISLKIDPNSLFATQLIIPNPGKNGFNLEPALENSLYLQEILNTFESDKHLYRVHQLQPNSQIRKHRDIGQNYEAGLLRIHIPVQTNKNSNFNLNGKDLKMSVGECWYVDIDLEHEVINAGHTERIHLVLDCQRNEWWENIFNDLQYKSEFAGPYSRMHLKELTAMKAQFELLNHKGSKATVEAIDAELQKRKHLNA